MAEQDNRYRERLLESGLKVTRQRLALLAAISQSETPLTAEELFMRLRRDFATLSLSTVYRALDTLCEKKMVSRSVLMDGGRAMFEIAPETHGHNLICTVCHKIVPIQGCPLRDYEDSLARSTGYVISGHKLEVYGVCPQCQSKSHAV
ncbi:Fur family transcriptional regulator [Ethanoligenens harbinense]|uniref:Ferric uptake regulator, Fur family n=1 Tax=Ethanoligenens harbinense (strain DSM 18485 / JCM 12961 / CGMCC 1.5033 / YUAN-3) TaxID=663278 RepID=E6U419_ETHHY|nr:Fur family transcriptional regulator [Ethanoligenens harbinense]ADU27699.1 ferric uptake regulator, Fur family [Ethanoligenens harbinense YUAN-3]AVQ96733.1 transcriptional repressor [Ethanoligenens harbinense YUAN-3]AYF39395.1 transcriptional repressor [Ethanoligenens harbinense]AYF42219.1 transcriptional repressor [Ethanoligenens harbinense]QCN92975.1 transcriptional repressor [Ethanoligenens harbinense]